MNESELRLIYGGAASDRAHIGDLQQNKNIGVHINIDDLVSRHFAVLGTTGVGKSSGVAVIVQKILELRPNLRIFLIDPHNEYTPCFGDKAQVFHRAMSGCRFGCSISKKPSRCFSVRGRQSKKKWRYCPKSFHSPKPPICSIRSADRSPLAKKRDPTERPVLPRIRPSLTGSRIWSAARRAHGQARNRSSRLVLSQADDAHSNRRNDPRYAFMFENANIGGDTMVDPSPAVSAAAGRQADDHHAACRFPGGGHRFRRLRSLPHGL